MAAIATFSQAVPPHRHLWSSGHRLFADPFRFIFGHGDAGGICFVSSDRPSPLDGSIPGSDQLHRERTADRSDSELQSRRHCGKWWSADSDSDDPDRNGSGHEFLACSGPKVCTYLYRAAPAAASWYRTDTAFWALFQSHAWSDLAYRGNGCNNSVNRLRRQRDHRVARIAAANLQRDDYCRWGRRCSNPSM